MNIRCLLGGYDGRFDRGENSKENLELRTPADMWGNDPSLYGRTLSEAEVASISDPILRSVAEQDLHAQQVRKRFKRSTPRASFGEDHAGL